MKWPVDPKDLSLCARCGAEAITQFSLQTEPWQMVVVCPICKQSGKPFFRLEDAVNTWNKEQDRILIENKRKEEPKKEENVLEEIVTLILANRGLLKNLSIDISVEGTTIIPTIVIHGYEKFVALEEAARESVRRHIIRTTEERMEPYKIEMEGK